METPALKDYTAKQGEFIKYKGRAYSWVNITDDGTGDERTPVCPPEKEEAILDAFRHFGLI